MGGCPCDRRAIGESPPCLVGPGLESAWVIIDQDWAVLSWWLSLPSVIWRRLGLSRRSGLGVPGESSSRETSKLQGLCGHLVTGSGIVVAPAYHLRGEVDSTVRVGVMWKVGQVAAPSSRGTTKGTQDNGRAVAVSGVENTKVIQ